jgi:hypothetical protein
MNYGVRHKYEWVTSQLDSHTIIGILPNQNRLIEPANGIMEISSNSNASGSCMGERQEVTGL